MSDAPLFRPSQIQPEPRDSLRVAGWALLAGSLVAFGYIVLPPLPMNPEWEFAAMDRLADNAFLPLLGIALVFHARKTTITRKRLIEYRAAAALAFTLGLLFAALLPLAVSDSERLRARLDGEIGLMETNEGLRVDKVERQLKKAMTVPELRMLGIMLNLKAAPGEVFRSEAEEVAALRGRLRKQVGYTHAERMKEIAAQRAASELRLTKDSVKMVLIFLFAFIAYLAIGFRNNGVFREHGPAAAP